MANLQLPGIYASKKTQFGMYGAGQARWDDDFLTALSRVISRINSRTGITPELEVPNDWSGELQLDRKFEYVVSQCLDRELSMMGRLPDKTRVPMVTERDLDNAIGDIWQSIAQAKDIQIGLQ